MTTKELYKHRRFVKPNLPTVFQMGLSHVSRTCHAFYHLAPLEGGYFRARTYLTSPPTKTAFPYRVD